MAIADKNILITPNTSGILGNQPNVVFTGADSSIGDSAAITVTARPENTGTLSFTGSAGQLFSITNDLSGTIFSVNDVSGIPSLEINDAGIIKLAEFNGRILLGGATDDSTSLLQLNGHMHLADNSEIRLGNDSDLLIYHDGSNSYIKDVGTGQFRIQSSTLIVMNAAGSSNMIRATEGSAIELYHNGSEKLSTSTTGVTVTGTMNADSATFTNIAGALTGNVTGTASQATTVYVDESEDDNVNYNVVFLETNSGGNIFSQMQVDNGGLQFNPSTNTLTSAGNVLIQSSTSSPGGLLTLATTDTSIFNGNQLGTIQWKAVSEASGTDAVAVAAEITAEADATFTSSVNSTDLVFKLGTSGTATEMMRLTHEGYLNFADNRGIKLGTGEDMSLQWDGTDGHLAVAGTLNIDGSGETLAKFIDDGAVELYHNNAKKFETLDSGVNITGNLRVNNAEFSAGASAGFAIAMAIAL